MDAHVDHILVVDDDREIRELVSTYLAKNGLRVTVAQDGRQMCAILEANAVDLIVLDVMMPGDDGLMLCRELRAGKHKTTPVLMLTARSDETDRILGLEMGADDYLPKPFAARELLAHIIVALSGAEYRLLRVFVDHPQRVLNRDQLLSLTQGREAEMFERSVDLLVSRLRQHLKDDAREPRYIKTVRSEGYVFSMPVAIREAQQ
ncbi:Response regulator, OmpR-family [Cupriavidus necator]|uniref:Response regulator n=1 Tax=Cupriavidus necator (strain ATCC 17699 / DSM 428 / KCTC 22496 / NCIMB 10442 / H16 / Stanier 337) TaxID=381666 RepID=Q0KAU9_CUPNH|nr:response regulator [Cupriavidus necator]QCC00731.1 response regulator [Cupriavidus necator H16]QQB76443.1 response regulator [Cupriavidus necator]WKA42614.1 response regulator [Cupriavidus necator]CAJ92872.1 response regulator, OmpR-family [Cupriavidus necator H16]